MKCTVVKWMVRGNVQLCACCDKVYSGEVDVAIECSVVQCMVQ